MAEAENTATAANTSDEANASGAVSAKPPSSRPRGIVSRFVRSSLRILLLAVGPLAILAGGGVYWATSGRYITTENAYVKADHVLVSPEIDGRVVKVHVRENQVVQADRPLFEIDPLPHRLQLEELDAKLAATRSRVAAFKAAHRGAKAELSVALRNGKFLEKEYLRRKSLAERNILPMAEFDDFRHRWQMSQQRVVTIREKIAETLAELGGDPELNAEAHPRYRELHAQRDQVTLRVERAIVRAPAQGVVSNVDLQVGEYVEEGKPVFSLMAINGLWVEANLKETQLTLVTEGQEVTLTVDAYPDYKWKARVASLSPGTGAEFSLLPPQNATGNWVKVVQRVPVRVEIEDDPDAPRLRAGMSVEVSIDTEYERPLPGIVQSALAAVGIER